MPGDCNEGLLGNRAWRATASWPAFMMTWDAALLALRGG